MSDEETKKPQLPEQLSRLSEAVEKSNSFLRSFFMGIVRGIGMALGATIIAAVALTVLWRVVHTLNLEELVQGFGVEIPNQESIIQGMMEEGKMDEQQMRELYEQYSGN